MAVFDGGNAGSVATDTIDGGNASTVPANTIDGGNAGSGNNGTSMTVFIAAT